MNSALQWVAENQFPLTAGAILFVMVVFCVGLIATLCMLIADR